jgi:hypothetical protein
MLQQYFQFAANVWREFAPGDYKTKFPENLRVPVTVPHLFSGQLPEELKGVPGLQVNVEWNVKEELSANLAPNGRDSGAGQEAAKE